MRVLNLYLGFGAARMQRRWAELKRKLARQPHLVSVFLGSPVDLERVEARHEHGVVTITLQKAETVRPRRIEIQAG
jgi:HSP20 family molecular chaperone IbpA